MIQPVSTLTPKVTYRGRTNGQVNPINYKIERELAILNAGGISAVTGALTTAISRSYTATWKNASLFGIGAAAITMMFVCPRLLYKSGIKSFTKEKEFDVFTKEKEVQQKLLTDVNEAIDNREPDLNIKLDNYSKAKTK